MGLLALTTIPQRIGFGLLGGALLAAGIFNAVQAVENRHLAKQVSNLDLKINDPKTGYVVRLTQAETNVASCSTAIQHQNTAIKAQSERDAATLAATQVRYDNEHAARVKAETSAAVFLAHEPEGSTLEDRVKDVDAQILGDLK